VLPDGDDPQDEHPWEWLVGLLRAHGVEASPVVGTPAVGHYTD